MTKGFGNEVGKGLDFGSDDTIYIFYDSYEQAAFAGIEYVLDNLI